LSFISREFSMLFCLRTTANVRLLANCDWLNYRTFAVVREHKCLLNARQSTLRTNAAYSRAWTPGIWTQILHFTDWATVVIITGILLSHLKYWRKHLQWSTFKIRSESYCTDQGKSLCGESDTGADRNTNLQGTFYYKILLCG